MFCSDENMKRINDVMMNDPVSKNHSGCSYGCTMRLMQSIAIKGYEYMKNQILLENKEREIKKETNEKLKFRNENPLLHNNFF